MIICASDDGEYGGISMRVVRGGCDFGRIARCDRKVSGSAFCRMKFRPRAHVGKIGDKTDRSEKGKSQILLSRDYDASTRRLCLCLLEWRYLGFEP